MKTEFIKHFNTYLAYESLKRDQSEERGETPINENITVTSILEGFSKFLVDIEIEESTIKEFKPIIESLKSEIDADSLNECVGYDDISVFIGETLNVE